MTPEETYDEYECDARKTWYGRLGFLFGYPTCDRCGRTLHDRVLVCTDYREPRTWFECPDDSGCKHIDIENRLQSWGIGAGGLSR